jgi:phage terminase large subunit
LWCLAEGSIFDFFDPSIHVLHIPPRSAEYYIAAIDYGQIHPFVCLLIGVSTGRYTQTGKCMWVEKEYFWDSAKKGRQKTNSEFADDIQEFLEPYGVKQIYIDPSAEAFQLELRKRGMHVVHANNSVLDGITHTCSEMAKGNLFIMDECKNTIRQIQSYVWDPRAAARGVDAPLKQDDDAPDALRYAIYSHKVPVFNHSSPQLTNNDHFQNRYEPQRRSFF